MGELERAHELFAGARPIAGIEHHPHRRIILRFVNVIESRSHKPLHSPGVRPEGRSANLGAVRFSRCVGTCPSAPITSRLAKNKSLKRRSKIPRIFGVKRDIFVAATSAIGPPGSFRSEEPKYDLKSLMRIQYAFF